MKNVVFFNAIHSGDIRKFVGRMEEMGFDVEFLGKAICVDNIQAEKASLSGIASGAKEVLEADIARVGGDGALILQVHTTKRDTNSEVMEISLNLQPYRLHKPTKGKAKGKSARRPRMPVRTIRPGVSIPPWYGKEKYPEVPMTTRLRNCLTNAQLTFEEAAAKTEQELFKVRLFGEITLRELDDILEKRGLPRHRPK